MNWRLWPWFTAFAAIFVAITPLGVSVIAGASSSEQLSRNIAQPMLAMAVAVVLALGALEVWIRRRAYRR